MEDGFENVEVTPKPKPRAPRAAPQKPSTKSTGRRTNGVRIAIAVVGVLGSVGVAFIKGYFDRIHIDERLANLSGIDVQIGAWGATYADSNWTLGKPEDPMPETMRTYQVPVKFPHKFTYSPKVFLSVSGVDISNENKFHYIVDTSDVSVDGFVIKIVASEKYKIYAMYGHWMAYQQ